MRVSLKRIITFFLVFAIVLCFVVPAFASQGTTPLITDTESVVAWESSLSAYANAINTWEVVCRRYWNYANELLARGYGSVDPTTLYSLCDNFNSPDIDSLVSAALYLAEIITDFFVEPTDRYVVMFDTEFSVYRIYDQRMNIWLVNQMGHFPYYAPSLDEDGNVPAVGEDTTGIQWLEGVFNNETHRHFVTYDVLEDYANYYGGTISYVENYYGIFSRDGGGTLPYGSYWLCDPHGYPFVTVRNPDSTAVNTPNDYIDEDGCTSTGQLIDYENNVVWFPDGTWYYLDQLIYDESTKTYYVDSHDQYVYDSFNNSFNTTSYYYEYNYYITHTTITYIGQTEEYEDPYQFYYKLPDGRSSADLTAEELEQLSLAFVDVINYARTADDINMRALYHFDGNLADASYWSYCSKFDWVEGASITYMDEGAFEGSLYLDEKKHVFDVILPSADMSGDFTIQFRYYQSYTSAPVSDSSIALGSQAICYFDGKTWYDRDLSALVEIPTGSWNEIALVREGDYLYYYLNGLCYGNISLIGSYGNTITFTFGSEQQTYKKLDELRVTKGALYSCGEDYTPTAVPYDTNLALILPDGEVAIADEYWTIIPPEGNLLSRLDFSDMSTLSVQDFSPSQTVLNGADSVSDKSSWWSSFWNTYGIYTFDHTASIEQLENGVSVTTSGDYIPNNTNRVTFSEYLYATNYPQNCIAINFTAEYAEWIESLWDLTYAPTVFSEYAAPLTFTFTIVDTSGNASYIVFKTRSGENHNLTYVSHSYTTFDIYWPYGFRDPVTSSTTYYSSGCPQFFDESNGTWNYGPLCFYLVPRSGSGTIAYMELIVGSEPGYELNWHSAVYSSGQLEEAPVLAVKSNTTVTEYQIGGVRPSYPTKGQVWALVENGRITSLQQYSGYAWLQVDGRIWTGERWIPTGSYDIFTMQDFWDMTGTTPKDEYTYIYSESGFWDWWQKQWVSFTGTLFDKMDDSGGGGGGSVPDLEDDPLLDEEDKQKFNEDEYSGIVKLMRKAYSFVSEFFSDFISGGLVDFLDFLSDPASPVYGLFQLSGLDGGGT